MWVQEGGDCKDADENISSSSLSSAFRSRFWLSNLTRNKKKQTITTIGIPMRKPKQNKPKPTKQNNKSQKSVTIEKKATNETKQETKMEIDCEEEKEREMSESPVASPIMEGIRRNVALSPAQFIENIGLKTRKSFDADDVNNNNKVDDISMFTIDDGKMDDDALQQWIDADDYDDGDITMDGDLIIADDKNEADNKELDLTIIGKQIAYLFDAVPVHPNEVYDDIIDNGKKQEENEENFDDLSKPLYISQAFNGLDIKKESEWQNCLNNNKQNVDNLLIIELYSKIFGPSNVMYSMIDEILVNKKQENNNIEFVRLSSEKLNEIDIIKQVINDYQCFISTPIPTYIFIKNGKKIDLLKGTQPTEFEGLIDKYLMNQDENEELFTSETTMKYKSILKERPSSSYLISTMNIINNNKENKSQNSNVENIKNLIKNLDIDSNQTTKLSKKTTNSSSTSTISCGTSTQSMFF